MSKSPARKKFKQSTIQDGFKRQASTATERESSILEGQNPAQAIDLTTEDQEVEEMSSNKDTADQTGTRDAIRNQTLHAAEKRKAAGSPDVTPVEPKSQQNRGKGKKLPLSLDVDKPPPGDLSNPQPGGATANDKTPGTPSDATSPTIDFDEMSPVLFDSEPDADEVLDDGAMPSMDVDADASDIDSSFKGMSKTLLKTSPDCSAPLPSLNFSQSHHVLVKNTLKPGEIPEPSLDQYQDSWDADHVKMPCSCENLYPVEGKNGGKVLQNRWELIQDALKGNITSSLDLEEAILIYNTRYCQRWNFGGLHAFFTEVLCGEETQHFFDKVLPKMVDLALQLPYICTQGIPLLKKRMLCSVTLSQQQVASLLANAFFCTFPRRNARQKQSEYSTYPDINFNQLFMGSKGGVHHRKAEKLKCIIHYFRRVTEKMPTGTITFKRQSLKEFPRWDQSQSEFTHLHVTSRGTIEDDGAGMLQVDFANKYLGGGVLGFGCVQEEIRFLICPEMIVSRLITEVLEYNECLIMTGCERYSNYTGYGDSFQWAGNHDDATPRDAWQRLCTEVVAIDALVIRNYTEQFQAHMVRRELNKAYVGFLTPGVAPDHLSAVATGNWGCGAFGGDLRLKALIQLMAAAEAKRDTCYFTFGDYRLRDQMGNIHKFITDKHLQVSDIWALIQQYYHNVCKKGRNPSNNLFDYIMNVYREFDEETDDEQDGEMSLEERYSWEQKNSPDYAANTP